MTTLTADVRLRARELDVALGVAPGEVVALLGPNGAGKTSLVAAIAGILPPDGGRIRLGEEVWDDPSADVHVAAADRRVGLVPQDLLLFPHLTVRDNVAFGPRSRGAGPREARRAAERWLARFEADHLGDRRPPALSGGEAQRVALARALAADPTVLLLDEPLGALDVEAKLAARRLLRTHLTDFAGPCVLVTHEPLEAFTLADRLVVLEGGRVTQVGTIDEVARRPRSPWVAQLVGLNLYRGVARAGVISLVDVELVTASQVDGEVMATVHPHAIALHRSEPSGSPRNVFRGPVTGVESLGDRVRVHVGGQLPCVAEVTTAAVRDLDLGAGGEVWVAIKATEIEVAAA